MKSLFKMILVLLVIGLVGFTIATTERESSISLALTEEFAPVPNRSSRNLLTIQYKERGTMRASWYGPRFHGRFTANGEIYDQNAMTAAHKSMKFGTILRITNLRSNKSVIVRINDRGPYIPGRHIDLSKAAAEELDVIKNGVKRLKIEEIIIKGIDNPFVSLN